MGGGLSRVADTSELVPVAYENVANLQRQMDSYMPAAVAIITAPANRRSSKRRSTAQNDAELLEQLHSSPPKKLQADASVKRTSPMQPPIRPASPSPQAKSEIPGGLICEEAEACPTPMVGSERERALSLGTDVVLSPLSKTLSVEKAVAVLGDEAIAAAIESTLSPLSKALSVEKAVAVLDDGVTAAASMAVTAATVSTGSARGTLDRAS